MKKLSDVLEAIQQDDQGKWDVEVPLNSLKVDCNGRIYRNAKHKKSLTSLALKQLCHRTIPHKGGNFVANSPLYLRRQALNFYLPRAGATCLCRGKGNSIRAVLSTDYIVYNNRHLVKGMIKALGSGPELMYFVEDFFLGPNSFWLTITFPSTQVRELGGLTGGIRLGNSEVGLRSVACYALVWRHLCSNGLMGWGQEQLFRKVHRGKLTSTQLTAKLAEAITMALDRANDLLKRFIQSAQEPVPNVQTVIKRLVEKRHLTQEFRDALLYALYQEDYVDTLFGLVNAMTRATQLYDGDRRVSIEQEAGRLLNWRKDEIYAGIMEGKV